MYDDIRVMNTATLIGLVEDGSEQGYNRTIEPEWVKQMADPDGFHVASILLFDHKAGRELKQHHRVEVLMKTVMSDQPHKFIIDVTAGMWSWLYTTEEWNAMMVEAQKPNPNFLAIGEKYGRVKYDRA